MRKHTVEVKLRLVVDAESIGQAVDVASSHISVRSGATVHRDGDAQIVAWVRHDATRKPEGKRRMK
jgi:hypothetical protein